MTDITDDIAEEISFQGFEDDCRLLGSLLNDAFQREVGTQFMEKVERTRVLAQVSSDCFLFSTLTLGYVRDTLYWVFFICRIFAYLF